MYTRAFCQLCKSWLNVLAPWLQPHRVSHIIYYYYYYLYILYYYYYYYYYY